MPLAPEGPLGFGDHRVGREYALHSCVAPVVCRWGQVLLEESEP
jgi:hypothetical protein